MLTLNVLQQNIVQWAHDRNLVEGSTPQKQMVKLYEEFGELANGFNKNNEDLIIDSIGDCAVVTVIMLEQLGSKYELSALSKREKEPEYTTERKMLFCGESLGRIAYALNRDNIAGMVRPVAYVVEFLNDLQLAATDSGLDFTACVAQAWDEIKDRKGKLIDGVFVKEGNLQ